MSRGAALKYTFTDEQTNKYQSMIRNHISWKIVIAQIIADTGMGVSNAERRYYALRNLTPVGPRPIDKYTLMICDGLQRKIIILALMEELGMSYFQAANRHGLLKRNARKAGLEIKVINPIPEPVPKQSPMPESKRVYTIPKYIMQQLEELPNYATVNEFKDKMCKMSDMAHYTVGELKTAYRQSHKNLKW